MRRLLIRTATVTGLLAAGTLAAVAYAVTRLADDPWEVPIASHRDPVGLEAALLVDAPYQRLKASILACERLGLAVQLPEGLIGRITVD